MQSGSLDCLPVSEFTSVTYPKTRTSSHAFSVHK